MLLELSAARRAQPPTVRPRPCPGLLPAMAPRTPQEPSGGPRTGPLASSPFPAPALPGTPALLPTSASGLPHSLAAPEPLGAESSWERPSRWCPCRAGRLFLAAVQLWVSSLAGSRVDTLSSWQAVSSCPRSQIAVPVPAEQMLPVCMSEWETKSLYREPVL